jgi:hypothetical protein
MKQGDSHFLLVGRTRGQNVTRNSRLLIHLCQPFKRMRPQFRAGSYRFQGGQGWGMLTWSHGGNRRIHTLFCKQNPYVCVPKWIDVRLGDTEILIQCICACSPRRKVPGSSSCPPVSSRLWSWCRCWCFDDISSAYGQASPLSPLPFSYLPIPVLSTAHRQPLFIFPSFVSRVLFFRFQSLPP